MQQQIERGERPAYSTHQTQSMHFHPDIVVASVRIDITYYQLVDDSDKPRCSRRRKLENSDADYIIRH